MKNQSVLSVLLMSACCLFFSCGGAQSGTSDGGGTGSTTQGQACTQTKDCGGNSVCLKVGQTKECSLTCTASANACGANSQCGDVGALSIDVCQPVKKDPVNPTQPAQPKAEEQPSIPCTSDEECRVIQEGTICVQFKNERNCTLPCTEEKQCDMPAMPGFKVDLLTCGADEANRSRKGCIPDEKCFSNISSCIQSTGPIDAEFDGGFPFP